jgi:hypothetical protein
MFRVRTPSRAPEPLRFVLGMIWLRLWGLLGPQGPEHFGRTGPQAERPSGSRAATRPDDGEENRYVGMALRVLFHRALHFSIARCREVTAKPGPAWYDTS